MAVLILSMASIKTIPTNISEIVYLYILNIKDQISVQLPSMSLGMFLLTSIVLVYIVEVVYAYYVLPVGILFESLI